MLRVLIVWFFLSSYFLLIITAPIFLNTIMFPLTVMPLAISFAVFFLMPIEGLFLILLLSLEIDTFLNLNIGLSLSISLLLWIGSMIASKWLGKPDRLLIFTFLIILSIVYRFILYFARYAESSGAGDFEWLNFLWAPFLDGAIGVYFIYFLHGLLVKLGLAQALLDISQRLSSRKMKGA